MAKKKEETVEETAQVSETTEEQTEVKAEKSKSSAKKTTKKKEAKKEESSIVEDVLDTAASVVENVVETIAESATDLIDPVVGSNDSSAEKGKTRSKRAEKIGVVWSDKMTNTVTVRVDRQVKHPMYRKYVKRKKKFMAHDELGATIGDKVRIVETRPLSARKRWRVVEIIQKAEK
jgi:ribosomal protein uS17